MTQTWSLFVGGWSDESSDNLSHCQCFGWWMSLLQTVPWYDEIWLRVGQMSLALTVPQIWSRLVGWPGESLVRSPTHMMKSHHGHSCWTNLPRSFLQIWWIMMLVRGVYRKRSHKYDKVWLTVGQKSLPQTVPQIWPMMKCGVGWSHESTANSPTTMILMTSHCFGSVMASHTIYH